MSDFPCLTLFRQGLTTAEIAAALGQPDEWRIYNRLAAEREFERARRRFDRATQEHVLLTETGAAWAEQNARKLAELTAGGGGHVGL